MLKGAMIMIEAYLLEQLAAVDTCGTLSAAAETLHLSQPTVTRSMHKLEGLIGVALFDRSKNRAVLNENGRLAAECARRILADHQALVDRVRALDRSRHTITIGAVSPGPMMELSPQLSSLYPQQAISTQIKPEAQLVPGLKNGLYQLIILNRPIDEPAFRRHPCGSERLYAGLPENHALAERKAVSFADMNGEKFLMFSNVGAWDELVRREMPASRFLLQTEMEALADLILSSSIASFATDIALRLTPDRHSRRYIPFSDPSAVMRYYCYCRAEDEKKYLDWFQLLAHRNE